MLGKGPRATWMLSGETKTWVQFYPILKLLFLDYTVPQIRQYHGSKYKKLVTDYKHVSGLMEKIDYMLSDFSQVRLKLNY